MHQRFTSPIVIVLIISVGLACSFLRPKSRITWQVLLELDGEAPDRHRAAQQTGSVIGRRLDALGVHDATILTQGPSNDQILVILPDVPDRKRLLEVITRVGRLELVAVVSPPMPAPIQTYSTREDALATLGNIAPGNRQVLPYPERSESPTEESSGTRQPRKWVVVESPAIVDGSNLRNARAVSYGSDRDYQISFSLGPEGAQKFGAWTAAHINDYMGVALNGEVKSIAYIKSQITDQGEISGSFTKQAAEDLALILRSGALPTPVKIIEIANKK